MNLTPAVLRAAAAIAIIVATTATFFDTASRATINPFNFFGFFTLQSNLLTAGVLLWAAWVGFTGRTQSPTLVLARACVTTYMVIVGIVYAVLLAPLAEIGGVLLPWANTVLHVVAPIYVILDWVVFADRPRLSFRRFWVVLVFPIVWVVVVLFRGATDGWVPYPFLSPSQGYGTVLVYCVGIAVAVGVVACAVWMLSRVRVVKVA